MFEKSSEKKMFLGPKHILIRCVKKLKFDNWDNLHLTRAHSKYGEDSNCHINHHSANLNSVNSQSCNLQSTWVDGWTENLYLVLNGGNIS